VRLKLAMSKFRSMKTLSRKGAKAQRKTQRNQRLCAFASLREKPLLTILVLSGLIFTTSCRRDMQDQPKIKPLRGTTFFSDGLASRQPIEGTIPRGYLRSDTEYFTGKKSRSPGAQTSATPTQQTAGSQQPTGAVASTYPDDVEVFPLPITEDVVKRGRERYDIFCSACHGLTGNGDGMIVRRGFRRAASFNDDRLRQAPVGHYFDAITNGWGAMPSYAPQIPVQDRWAIVAYIRALQLSQQNSSASASPSPAASNKASPAPRTPGGHQ
jgi:mono/diheme cytochrome c family protein